jgi:predicted nucleic acid-binding protein
VSRYPKIRAILPAHRIGTMINHLQRALVLDTLLPLPDHFDISDKNDEFLLALARKKKSANFNYRLSTM